METPTHRVVLDDASDTPHRSVLLVQPHARSRWWQVIEFSGQGTATVDLEMHHLFYRQEVTRAGIEREPPLTDQEAIEREALRVLCGRLRLLGFNPDAIEPRLSLLLMTGTDGEPEMIELWTGTVSKVEALSPE